MQSENNDDLLGMNLNTPLGKVLKDIRKLCAIKKVQVDEELGKLLDNFLAVLLQANDLIDNGMYFTGFPEAALILEAAGAIYGKKVDVLLDEVLTCQHRNILYAKDDEQHIKAAELKKLRERLEKHRGRKKKLHIQITDEDLQVQDPQQQAEPVEIIDVEEYQKILDKKWQDMIDREEQLYGEFMEIYNEDLEEFLARERYLQKKIAKAAKQNRELDEWECQKILIAYNTKQLRKQLPKRLPFSSISNCDDFTIQFQNHRYSISELRNIKIIKLMEKHFNCGRIHWQNIAKLEIFSSSFKPYGDPKIIHQETRGALEFYFDYSRTCTYDLHIFYWHICMIGYFDYEWFHESYKEGFVYWEYITKFQVPADRNKEAVLKSKGFQIYCDSLIMKYLKSRFGPNIKPPVKLQPMHIDLILKKFKKLPNCDELIKKMRLNENSLKKSKQIKIPLKRMSLDDIERVKIRLSQDSGFFDDFSLTEAESFDENVEELDITDEYPSIILEQVTFRCEKGNDPQSKRKQRFKVINLILDRFKRKLEGDESAENPSKRLKLKDKLESDFCDSYEDFIEQLEHNKRKKIIYSDLTDLSIGRNESVYETDLETIETEKVIQEFYSNEIVVECPAPPPIEENTKKFNVQKEMDKVYKNVQEWKRRIYPVLEKLENKEFDIHEYGSKIFNKMKIGESSSFSSIVAGQNRSEVIKYFVSSLQLANTNNVEISGYKAGEIANETLELKLLSTDRYHEHLTEFSAPSIAENRSRMSQVAKRQRTVDPGEGCSFWTAPPPPHSPAKRPRKKR